MTTIMKNTDAKKMYKTMGYNVKVGEMREMEDVLVDEVINELMNEEMMKEFVEEQDLVPKTKVVVEKDKYIYKGNDMMEDNSVDNLIMRGRTKFIKHPLTLKANGSKGRPEYPHSDDENSPYYKDPEKWTNWSIHKIRTQEEYCRTTKKDRSSNAFSVDMGNDNPYFVIDTDDKETDDMVMKHYGHLPYTESFSGKGRHYWAKKHPDDVGKYVRQTKVKGKLDILYSGNTYERRIDEEGNAIIVKNWDGSTPIPVVKMSDLEKKLEFKMPSSTQTAEQRKRTNIAKNKELTEFHGSNNQVWGSPRMLIEKELAMKILSGLYTQEFADKYDFKMWKTTVLAWFFQVPNDSEEEDYFNKLQRFTEKIYSKCNATKTVEEWKNENVSMWKWCGENCNKPETDYYKSTLWKLLHLYNPTKWKELSIHDTGSVVSNAVLNTIGDYHKLKEIFELWNYELVGQTNANFVEEDKALNNSQDRNMAQLKDHYRDVYYLDEVEDKEGNKKMKTFPFIKRWLYDTTRRQYRIRDFLPTGIEETLDCEVMNRLRLKDCVKNNFEGLKADDMNRNMEIREKIEEMKAKAAEEYGDPYHDISKILQHIYYLSGGNCKEAYGYLLKWIAHRVRFCGIQPKVACVFKSVQGVGKDMFFAWLGNEIIGAEYYLNTDDYQKIFGQFNSVLMGKLLLALNESSYGDTKKFENAMKTLITDPKRTGEKKYKDSEDMRMCAGLILFTNKEYVMNFQLGNRRFQFFLCEDKHLNHHSYFDELQEEMSNEYCKALFVDYLYTQVEVNATFDFKNARVMNDYQRNLLRRGEPLINKFIRWIVRCWDENETRCDTSNCFKGMYVAGWYELYKQFIKDNGGQEGNGTKSLSNFQQDFIVNQQLKKTDDPEDLKNYAKIILSVRGHKSCKYKLDGNRTASYLSMIDDKMGYYDKEDKPTYEAIRSENPMFFLDSDDEEHGLGD
jgi:ribosomal protein S3AE